MTVGGTADGTAAVKYTGTMDAFRKVIAAEGPSALFRGAGANILRYVVYRRPTEAGQVADAEQRCRGRGRVDAVRSLPGEGVRRGLCRWFGLDISIGVSCHMNRFVIRSVVLG